jgi:hypothetical protein
MTHYRGIELDDTRPEEHDGHMDGIDAVLDDLPIPHYHVVAFINGCLNDYDSGPIESLEMAQDHFAEIAPDWETGIHIVKIEDCTEDCDPDDLS